MLSILLFILFLLISIITVLPQLRSLASRTTERFRIDAKDWHIAKELLEVVNIERKHEFYCDGEMVFDIELDDAECAAELLGLERKK